MNNSMLYFVISKSIASDFKIQKITHPVKPISSLLSSIVIQYTHYSKQS